MVGAESLLTEVFEHLAVPVFIKDRASRWVLVNQAFCALVGSTREQLLGQSGADLFPRELAALFLDRDREVFEQGAVVVAEGPLTGGDGERRVVQATQARLRLQGADYLVGSVHDVTAAAQAQRDLQAARAALALRAQAASPTPDGAGDLARKQRLVVLGQLTRGMAHQLRNPLSAILNASGLLRDIAGDRPETPPELGIVLKIIEEEVWSANRLIEELLDYARDRPPERQPSDLRELLSAPLSTLPRNIAVTLELPEGLPLVLVDAHQVVGALTHLLRNAQEAMPAGGGLTISARVADDVVVADITDTGPGISEAMMASLFEPMVTHKAQGLGLGLVSARAHIEKQGGRLDALHAPGGGACFRLTLPVVRSGGRPAP
jgi:PAS domain S-box-containing protein